MYIIIMYMAHYAAHTLYFYKMNVIYIPGSVHLSPMYPSAQLHVSLETQAPCMQGGSQTTTNKLTETINVILSAL